MRITKARLRALIREAVQAVALDAWIDPDQAAVEFKKRLMSGESEDEALDAVVLGHHDDDVDPASLTPVERSALLKDLRDRSASLDPLYLSAW